MAKKCLREGEKSAPFLRQKRCKKYLFSSISQKKVEQNKRAKCQVILEFVVNMILSGE